MRKIRFLPLLCVLLILFTAPTLLAQQEPDTPYPAETMLSVRMMPPGERSLRNFLYPKLMAQEGSIQLPAGTSYNLLVQTLDNMRNDYPELFHIESYRVHYQRNQPDVAQSISPRYLCSAEEASALRKQLLETAQSWVDENPDPLALYERLVQNTTYSPDSMWQHAAVGALLYGEATCAGYAQAISLLYRLAGIPCATIIGEASDTSGETGLHAWNVTNFGFLDATWGAAFDGHVFHSNYAMGEADMSIDHTPNRGYTFPDLSGVPNYYQAHGLYVSTEQELLTQLMRLVDGETVEIQLSPDLYARYTAAMKDKPSDIVTFCAEAAGAEIPFYDPCQYGDKKSVHNGPMCTGMTVNHEGKAILSFEAGTDKLRVVDELKGFAIAGADGHFQWAEAVVVNGNQVAVWHKDIPHPVTVRYGWDDNPVHANLRNMAGLPASPFQISLGGQ